MQAERAEKESVRLAAHGHWVWTVPLGLVCGGIAAAAVYELAEPLYEAKAVIRISESTPYIAFLPDREGPDEFAKFVRTQIELIRSPLVLGPVVSKPDIARLPEIVELDDPITELAPQIGMTSVGGSELVNISFKGPNPGNAAKLVNAVTDAYFTLRDRLEAERSARVIELLEKESAARAVEVTRFRENVRELAKQTTGEDPFAPATTPDRNSFDPLVELKNRLASIIIDQATLRAQMMAYEEMLKEPIEIPASSVDQAVEDSGEVQQLKTQIAADELKRRQTEAGDARDSQDPPAVRPQHETEQAKQMLEKLCQDLRARIKTRMEAALTAKYHTGLAETKLKLRVLMLTERELKTRYDEQLHSLQQVSGTSLELEFKRDELKRAQDVYDRIVSRIVALRTEWGAPARVESLIPAMRPAQPVEGLPYKKMALAFAGGYGLPLLFLLLRRVFGRRRTLKETDETRIPET